MRAARGLLESKLTSPQAISDAPLEEEVEALHSEGNVQRGISTCWAQLYVVTASFDMTRNLQPLAGKLVCLHARYPCAFGSHTFSDCIYSAKHEPLSEPDLKSDSGQV